MGLHTSISPAGSLLRTSICVSTDAAKTDYPFQHSGVVQGSLAHKKQPPPLDHHRTLGIVLLKGPRRGVFLMSEVPVYTTLVPGEVMHVYLTEIVCKVVVQKPIYAQICQLVLYLVMIKNMMTHLCGN